MTNLFTVCGCLSTVAACAQFGCVTQRQAALYACCRSSAGVRACAVLSHCLHDRARVPALRTHVHAAKRHGCVSAGVGVPQTFVETDNPAILFNGNNEYLHYQDTWYILAYKPDTYVVSRQHPNSRLMHPGVTSLKPCIRTFRQQQQGCSKPLGPGAMA